MLIIVTGSVIDTEHIRKVNPIIKDNPFNRWKFRIELLDSRHHDVSLDVNDFKHLFIYPPGVTDELKRGNEQWHATNINIINRSIIITIRGIRDEVITEWNKTKQDILGIDFKFDDKGNVILIENPIS